MRIQAIYPTTPVQRGYLLGSLARPGDGLYLEQAQFTLLGELDVDCFRIAFSRLVERHEILRTGFAINLSDVPRQVVMSDVSVDVPLIEVVDVDDAAEEAVAEVLAEQRSTPFDVASPPLLRVALVRRRVDHHILVWTHHHAVLDGWSQIRLLDELFAIDEVVRDSPPPFGEYAAYAARRDLDGHVRFWKDHLVGVRTIVPLDHRSVDNGCDLFRTEEFALPRDASQGLKRMARSDDLTDAAVFIAIWSMVAAELHDVNEIVVGVTVAGRSATPHDTTATIGPFATTIPARVVVDVGEPVQNRARRLQDQLAQAAPYADISSAQIHGMAGAAPGVPLYESIVAYANYPALSKARGVVQIPPDSVRGYGGRTLYPITVVVTESGETTVRITTDRRRFPDDLASVISGELRQALCLIGRGARIARINLPEQSMKTLVPASSGIDLLHDSQSEGGMLEDVVERAFGAVLRRSRVPRDRNFFDLGGHSVVALELVASLQRAFDTDFTLADLLADPTVGGVAYHLRALLGAGPPAASPTVCVTPIPDDGQPFPLSEIQEAYWVGRQRGFELSDADAHVYAEFDVAGLDLDRLEVAWNRLIARHPSLRTVITDDGRQRVLEEVPPYRIPTFVVGDRDAHELKAARNRLSAPRRNLGEWPLFSVEAAQLPRGSIRLFLSFDLLIGDAQSWRILANELRHVYRDPVAPLPALEITYRDYLRALDDTRSDLGWEQARRYWRDRLPDLPDPPALPKTRESGSLQRTTFVRRKFAFDAFETAALRLRAVELGVSLSSYLLAAFGEILRRFSNSSRFLVNLTVFDRIPLHPQVADLVGDFTSLNLTVLDDAGETFGDRVRRVQRQVWTDLDHRRYGGLAVLRDLSEQRGTRRTAGAPVVFTSTLDLPSMATEVVEGPPTKLVHAIGQTPQVELDYQLYEDGGCLVVNWDAIAELFEPTFLDEMFAAHTDLLHRLAGEPKLAMAPTVTTVKRPRAPIASPLGGRQLLHDPFLEQASRTPNALAIVAGGRRLSYGETAARATAIARLIGAPPRGGGMVAIVTEKGWQQVVGALGALLAGRTFVPIDAGWPSSRIADLLERTGADVVITTGSLSGRVDAAAGVRNVIVVDEGDLQVRDWGVVIPKNPATASDIAYVVFTSGSAGEPKGVMIRHESALNTILDINERFGVNAADRAFAISPFSFDLAFYDVFGLLAAGGAMVIPTERERRQPATWLQSIVREGITIWNSVPALMELLTAECDEVEPPPLRTLRACLLSGDWIPLSLPPRIASRAPDARIVSLGGATECAIWSIIFEIDKVDPRWRSIPYGYGMVGQRVEVLDDQLSPCPTWVTGQIHIGGCGLAAGYLADAERTARAFVVDGYDDERWYRTGDFGRLLPSGAIEFMGRRDQQVKIDGFRVELRELESTLAGVDGVRQAAVVATGDRFNRRLAAFYTGTATSDHVIRRMSEVLPSYMVPRSVRPIDALPLNATGKVDRSALLKLASGSSELRDATSRSDLSELTEVIGVLLGSPPDPDDNLLDRGMTSIEVIRLLNAIEHRFGIRPAFEGFYDNPSVRGLSRLVSRRAVEGTAAPESISAPPIASGGESWPVRPTDETERRTFQRSHPRLIAADHQRRLPTPPVPDLDRYARRRSHRRYSPEPVPLASISELLAALRCVEINGRGRFLYPSAGGLYSVDAYIHVRPNRVDALDAGLFYYHPDAHDLVLMVGDIDLDERLHVGSTNRPVAEQAAFTIFLVTDPQDSAPLYGQSGATLNRLNAGYMGQLLSTKAEEVGLGLCALDGYHFDRVRWMLPAGYRVELTHLLVGGVPVI